MPTSPVHYQSSPAIVNSPFTESCGVQDCVANIGGLDCRTKSWDRVWIGEGSELQLSTKKAGKNPASMMVVFAASSTDIEQQLCPPLKERNP